MARGRVSPPSAARAAKDARRLGRLAREYGPDAAREKLELLERLADAVLPTPGGVRELHEAACFLRAYPDSREVLDRAVRILDGFAERRDLLRHKDALASSGIAGTDTHFAYYWFTTCRLARRWPELMSIEWSEFDEVEALEELLPLLLRDHELLALEEDPPTAQELIAAIKGPSETDAVFLVHVFQALRADPLLREKLYDDLVVPLVLAAGKGTPSRTHAAFPVRRVAFQTAPIAPGDPRKRSIAEEPSSVRRASPADGARLVWLAQESMMTRQRDLYAFIHSDPDDVLLVDYRAGLQFACIGMIPERRHVLHGTYVILALKNGVPVAYLQATTLFESAEVNYNLFDTFRAAEASRIFTAGLAMMRHLFGARTFAINTQQLGEGNPEALATGAWWFYHKHGFRPDGTALRRLAERELAARRRDPSRRSSLATLRKLASEPLFLDLGRRHADAMGRLDVSALSVALGGRLSERMSCGRGQIERRCTSEAAALLGVRDTGRWSHDERLALKRWAPIVLALPGVDGWPAAERRALARVVRAKGARHELDYVRVVDAHAALRRALTRLARA